jgi:hypothetical protein
MPITAALIGGGSAILGGLIGGSSARSAASTQSAAQLEAARIAAAESRFRPVGITTRFGGSQFTTGVPGLVAPVATDFATPEEFAAAQGAYQTRLQNEGRVTGASYTLDPTLSAYRERFLGLAGGALTDAEGARQRFAPLGTASQGLFNLGQKYLAESPEQAAEKYILGRQNLLAPSRERQLAGLRTNLFNTGRQGLSVGGTGLRPGGGEGLRASNPELEAYYNAIAQQDAQLAAEGMQGGMEQTRFGSGLFATGGNLATQMYGLESAALGPYQAYLSGATNLEALGQQPLELGSALGGRIANTAGANALLQGGMGAAQSNFAANAYNPFAAALTGFSQNPALINAASNRYAGGNYNAVAGDYFRPQGGGGGFSDQSGGFNNSLTYPNIT